MNRVFNMLPVVHAGAFYMFVIQRKGDRLDQVKMTSGAGADTPDISGILRNFGGDEHNVEKKIFHETGSIG